MYMKRFCKECGKEAQPGDHVCVDCGTALTSEENPPQQPMTKKKKMIWAIVASLVIFVIGFSVWATSYQSPQAVEKRFHNAVDKQDHKKLQKLMVHEDGTPIHEKEAEAFLELVNQDGKRKAVDLCTVIQHGKFLGIYDAYKIAGVDQFARYDAIDGLTFSFNGTEIDEYDQDEESVVYGPFAPGIYPVKAMFKGEYGETNKEDTLTLARDDYDDTWMDMDLSISKVTFNVENYEEFNPSEAHIRLNDEEIAISKEGETEEVGPFILDGSQEVEVVVNMPWGEVVSKPIAVDDSYMDIHADLISEKQYKQVKQVLKDFGEQYVESSAKKSTKPLVDVSSDVKNEVKDMIPIDDYYSGKLKTVEVDKHSITVMKDAKEPGIQILAQYQIDEDYHDLTEEPVLEEVSDMWSLSLSFDKDQKTWKIQSLDTASIFVDFEPTDELKGSKKVYGPSKEAIANAEEEETEGEIEEFIMDYTQASVDAINYRDFGIVEDYITSDGPRKKEAREYIDYLDSKDIFETWYGSELEKIEKVDDQSWKVTVIEEFEIVKPDTSNNKEFRTTVLVKKVDGEYFVHELISTDEI